MSKATYAIIKHYSSTPEKPNHEDCHQDRNSWCSCNRGIAAGTNYHQPIKNPVPPAFAAEIQPLFDRLRSKQFLASCEKGSTQNLNEAYHQVVWKLAPKEQYNSPWEIKLVVEVATLLFNSSMQCTFKTIAHVVGVTVTQNMTTQWDDIDKKRTTEKLWKLKKETKTKRKKFKRGNIKKQEAFSHTEGDHYKSGAFQGSCSKK